jgi:hypothetical protein
MSISEQVCEYYLNPANLGAERTLKEISDAIDCDDDKLLGIELWGMVNRTHKLKCEKNAEGKNAYRWNDKRESASGGGASKPKRAGKKLMAKPAKVRHYTRRKAVKKAERKGNGSLAANLWALRQDGAFVLLGTQTEIPRAEARALVEFVRILDRGEASA